MRDTLHRVLLGLGLIALVAPIWLVEFPPMVDMPQHAALAQYLLDWSSPSKGGSELFGVNLFTPYLVGYLILYLLGLFLPLMAAIKIVLSLAVAAVPISVALINRRINGNPFWDWLGFPLAYSFSFYWGFFTFIAAIPFALLFILAFLRLSDRPTAANLIAMSAFAVFLTFTHLLVAGFAFLASGAYALFSMTDFRGLALRLAPLIVPVPMVGLMMKPILSASGAATSLERVPLAWNLGLYRYGEFFSGIIGMPQQPLFVGFGALILLSPFLTGARIARRFHRWAPFLVCTVLVLTIPGVVLGVGYMYQRFHVFLLPLLLFGLTYQPLERGWRVLNLLPPAVAIIAMVAVGQSFLQYDRQGAPLRAVLGQTEPGKRLLGLILDRQGDALPFPTFFHFHAWYPVIRGGVADYSFAQAQNSHMVVHYREDLQPRVDEVVGAFPRRFDWDRHLGRCYDYLLVRALAADPRHTLPWLAGRMGLVEERSGWWLFRNLQPPPEGSAACVATANTPPISPMQDPTSTP